MTHGSQTEFKQGKPFQFDLNGGRIKYITKQKQCKKCGIIRGVRCFRMNRHKMIRSQACTVCEPLKKKRNTKKAYSFEMNINKKL